MIDIQKINDTLFEVTVTDSSTTKHQVTISDEYHLKLTSGKISMLCLVRPLARWHRAFSSRHISDPITKHAILMGFTLSVREPIRALACRWS